jgi:hypothetical protein
MLQFEPEFLDPFRNVGRLRLIPGLTFMGSGGCVKLAISMSGALSGASIKLGPALGGQEMPP